MNCILCEHDDYFLISNKLRDANRKVLQCKNCKLISIENPMEDVMDYSSEYRKSHGPIIDANTGKEESLSPEELFKIQSVVESERLNRIRPLLKNDLDVLEIGSSTGHVLSSIQNKVNSVAGIELDLNHAEFSRKKFNLEIYDKPIESLNIKKKFDIIFSFQVFEHIPNPLEFLSICKKFLKKDGIIYFELPNVNDAILSIYNIPFFKNFYFRKAHPYYYSKITLEKIMKKAGFSGTINSIQDYSLFNHVNWILTKKPQSDQILGYSELSWDFSNNSEHVTTNSLLINWFKKTNQEYKKLLEDNDVTEHLSYLGCIES